MWRISKGASEIPLRISCPYIQRHNFYALSRAFRFKSFWVFWNTYWAHVCKTIFPQWHMYGPKPVRGSMLMHYQQDAGKQTFVKLKPKYKHFHSRNTINPLVLSHTKNRNVNVPFLILQLGLPNPLKSGDYIWEINSLLPTKVLLILEFDGTLKSTVRQM